MKCFCCLKYYFVVHRAAEQRMRMADESDEIGIRGCRSPQHGFEAACGPRQKQAAMEYFSHQKFLFET
jgi:hypothetical protein